MKVCDLYIPFISYLHSQERNKITIDAYQRSLKIIDSAIGERDLMSLIPIDADLIVERARPVGHSIPTNTIVAFRMLLKFARRTGIEMSLDWREIEMPPYEVQKPVEYLTPREIGTVRDHLSGDSPPKLRDRALFELILHSGLRIGEAISIDIKDIDFEEKEIRIYNQKGGRPEKVYFKGAEKYLKKYLDKRNDDHPALFLACSPYYGKEFEDRRFTIDTAKNAMWKMKHKLKLQKCLCWHIIRKTYGTILLLNGVDPKSVQYLMRHKSIITTFNHYIAVDEIRSKESHARVMATL